MEDEKGNESWWLISLSKKDYSTCDVIAQAFIFKQALPEQAEVSGRIDWNITECVLTAKGSVQKGSRVRTSQIFSCWFCKQGDGKRGPWKNNSWLQKEEFCPRLGWIMQNQTLQLLRLLWVQEMCEFCLHWIFLFAVEQWSKVKLLPNSYLILVWVVSGGGSQSFWYPA